MPSRFAPHISGRRTPKPAWNVVETRNILLAETFIQTIGRLCRLYQQHAHETVAPLGYRIRLLLAARAALARNQSKMTGHLLATTEAIHIAGLMAEVLEDRMRYHLTDASKEKITPELADDLIDLVRAYIK